jgi:membrane-bound inhibitor of C-type lysozyme
MAGSDQCGFTQGRRQVRSCFVIRATPFQGQGIMTALLLFGAAVGTAARDAKPVPYTICADETELQATFSPTSTSMGSVKLVYAGSATETILLQAVSADGARYAQADVEFWIQRKVLDQRKRRHSDPSQNINHLQNQRLRWMRDANPPQEADAFHSSGSLRAHGQSWSNPAPPSWVCCPQSPEPSTPRPQAL